MKNIRFAIIAALFCIIGSTFCSCESTKYNLPKENLVITRSDGSTITVNAEIAKRMDERNHGFMGRKNIPDGTGMLFVFEADQIMHFWMKDTPHPLSIAYIDRKGTIVDIFDMTPFDTSDVDSTRYCRYALEVPQGWFAANNIKKGDTITGTALYTLNY